MNSAYRAVEDDPADENAKACVPLWITQGLRLESREEGVLRYKYASFM